MKRCPECGREYDNTMSFCLDDGAELLYGPASMEGSSTAILQQIIPPSEAATRAQIATTGRMDDDRSRADGGSPTRRGFDKRLAVLGIVAVIMATGGVLGYRYSRSAKIGQIDSIAVLPFQN